MGCEAKGLSKGRYDETFAGEDDWVMELSPPPRLIDSSVNQSIDCIFSCARTSLLSAITLDKLRSVYCLTIVSTI